MDIISYHDCIGVGFYEGAGRIMTGCLDYNYLEMGPWDLPRWLIKVFRKKLSLHNFVNTTPASRPATPRRYDR